MRHLESAAQQSKGVTREEAVANAKTIAEQLDMRLPLTLENNVTVVRCTELYYNTSHSTAHLHVMLLWCCSSAASMTRELRK